MRVCARVCLHVCACVYVSVCVYVCVCVHVHVGYMCISYEVL